MYSWENCHSIGMYIYIYIYIYTCIYIYIYIHIVSLHSLYREWSWPRSKNGVVVGLPFGGCGVSHWTTPDEASAALDGLSEGRASRSLRGLKYGMHFWHVDGQQRCQTCWSWRVLTLASVTNTWCICWVKLCTYIYIYTYIYIQIYMIYIYIYCTWLFFAWKSHGFCSYRGVAPFQPLLGCQRESQGCLRVEHRSSCENPSNRPWIPTTSS